MKPMKNVERAFKRKLHCAAGPTLRAQVWADVLHAQERRKKVDPARTEPTIRSIIMKNPITRLVSAAAVIAIVLLSIALWSEFTTPAYALDQTVAALKNVRFLHIIGRDDQGRTKDERWIEIGMGGRQVRYRQQNPLWLIEQYPGVPSMVIEDGESTAVYRHDRKAVILYDRKDMQYQWIGKLGEAFENLRQEGKILEENGQYKGRRAHKVWWPAMKGECYVDPDDKLPIAIGDTELSYEVPAAGTFDIIFPEGYARIDRRPGATDPIPQWLTEEENARDTRGESFTQGAQALARGEYAEAAGQLELALGYDSWAPFWLGSACYGLGQYESAITHFTATLALYKQHAPDRPIPYCNYARGLAYARSGHLEAAKADFAVCLPAMVRTLRIPSAGYMFEYADDPMIRFGQPRPSGQQTVAKMVNRLRLITGANFGYNPDATPEENEAAIMAWEQWLADDGSIKFTPDDGLIAVPTTENP